MHYEQVRATIAAALAAKRFVGPFASAVQTEFRPGHLVPWELFRGHLLDASQTRQRRRLDSWLTSLSDLADAPLLAIHADAEERRLYVVRFLQVYGHEAYDNEGVIDTRPVVKWHPELVGSLDWSGDTDPEAFRASLERTILLAFVGTSRLPISSLESPLPCFLLGHLAYRPRGEDGQTAMRELEFALRQGDEAACSSFASRSDFPQLVRTLFMHLSLSPWTGVVERLTDLVLKRPVEEAARTLGFFLRHLCRHLTAYDLRVFHNRGANYPDALALDLWLRALAALLQSHPGLMQDRGIRRAVRQAWLVRKQIEGLPVPDHPTSPGENQRVMPEPFCRLPEEQVRYPERRHKRLFAGDPAETLLAPAVREALRLSVQDLAEEAELRELGLGLFLDRPLGVWKAPGEVDRTPLFAYEAFSSRLARQRLDSLRELGWLTPVRHGELAARAAALGQAGIEVRDLPGRPRPGVVALEDALQASPDFVVLAATRGTQALARRLLPGLDSAAGLPYRGRGRPVLPIRSPASRLRAAGDAFLTVYDDRHQPALEYGLGQEAGGPVRYREQAGSEELAGGLRLLRWWDDQGREQRTAPGRVAAS
jgi:hypothetical protein